jgi:hypothetical protein
VKGTFGVLSAEWLRLTRGRAVLLGGLFVAAVSALRVLGARAADAAAHAAAVQRALAAGRTPPELAGPGNAYAPLAQGWLAGLTVGTLLLLVLASHGLAADRERGVLRLASTRSATRGALVLGRALVGVGLVLALLALTGLAAFAAAAWSYDFGPLVEHGYQLLSEEELRQAVVSAAVATVPPLLATWCFGLAISSLSRSAVGAVAVSLAAWLGFDLFKEVLGDRQFLVFAAFSPSFVDGSAMGELVDVARGLSDAGYSEGLQRLNLVLPWPWALALLGLAWWATSRRSL